mgnify:CR=1 FL=1
MTDYTPIDCGRHSEFELAIMQRRHLHLCWLDEQGQSHEATLLPTDLCTRNHEEFLLARDADEQPLEIRLDRIQLASK